MHPFKKKYSKMNQETEEIRNENNHQIRDLKPVYMKLHENEKKRTNIKKK